MKLEERLTLTEVDMTEQNAARIGLRAASVIGQEERPSVLFNDRLVPACAFAFAAMYLWWAAQQAGLL
jgi:hypothetical protein